MSLTCPRCGLFSPDGTYRCDCGYDFRVAVQRASQTLPTYQEVGNRTALLFVKRVDDLVNRFLAEFDSAFTDKVGQATGLIAPKIDTDERERLKFEFCSFAAYILGVQEAPKAFQSGADSDEQAIRDFNGGVIETMDHWFQLTSMERGVPPDTMPALATRIRYYLDCREGDNLIEQFGWKVANALDPRYGPIVLVVSALHAGQVIDAVRASFVDALLEAGVASKQETTGHREVNPRDQQGIFAVEYQDMPGIGVIAEGGLKFRASERALRQYFAPILDQMTLGDLIGEATFYVLVPSAVTGLLFPLLLVMVGTPDVGILGDRGGPGLAVLAACGLFVALRLLQRFVYAKSLNYLPRYGGHMPIAWLMAYGVCLIAYWDTSFPALWPWAVGVLFVLWSGLGELVDYPFEFAGKALGVWSLPFSDQLLRTIGMTYGIRAGLDPTKWTMSR